MRALRWVAFPLLIVLALIVRKVESIRLERDVGPQKLREGGLL